MLFTGIFPDKLKVPKIIPIHKKEDETVFTNYRPISLLPAISKIFEKVIFNNCIVYFKKIFKFIMHSMVLELSILQNLPQLNWLTELLLKWIK